MLENFNMSYARPKGHVVTARTRINDHGYIILIILFVIVVT